MKRSTPFLGHPAAYVMLLPALIHVMIFFLVPLLVLLRYSFYKFIPGQALEARVTPENYIAFLTDPFYLRILADTLAAALAVSVAALVLGYPLAYGMAKASPRTKKVYYVLVLMPLLTSAVIRTYGWTVFLSRNGLLNRVLISLGVIARPLDILYTYPAFIIGSVGIFLPFMVLTLSSVLEGILDSNVCDASESLGAGPLRTFVHVTFPLSLPGVLSGTILVFVLTMATFVIPTLLGGTRVKVIATQVYQHGVFLLNWPFAAAMAFVLLVAAGILVSLYYRLLISRRVAWEAGD